MEQLSTYLQRLSNDPAKLRRFGLLLIMAFLVVIVAMWVFNQSVIVINQPDNEASNTHTRIINSSGKNVFEVVSSESTLQTRVPRGNYEVIIKKGEESYYQNIKTKPLLQKTIVASTYKKEAKREFIGNNPGPCGLYSDVLITYSCDGLFSDTFLHTPADASSPTTTINDSSDLGDSSMGGILDIKGQKYAFLEGSFDPESERVGHALFKIGNNLSLDGGSNLDSLAGENFYKTKKYKDGFIVYSATYDLIYYYSSLVSDPEEISIDSPAGSNFIARGIATDNNRIAVFYSAEKATNRADLDSEHTHNGKTVVQIFEDGETSSHEFDLNYTQIDLCDLNKLCYLASDILYVYDVAGKKKLLYVISDVSSFDINGDELAVAKSDGVVAININTKSGHYIYTNGEYQNCGFIKSNSGFVICIISPLNERSALYLDLAKDNTDSIDKKIINLSLRPFVENVSVYKNYIHIAPNVGEPIYDPSLGGSGGFTSDPVLVQQTAQQINEAVKDIGINNTLYTIINTQL